MTEKVTIVGGGPTGALAGLMLAKRGYEVHVYEGRADPRASVQDGSVPIAAGETSLKKAADASKRSINLALSHRGLRALERVDLVSKALAMSVPMRGRMIHSKTGAMTLQRYGTEEHEVLYSVSRLGMNTMLLEALDEQATAHLHFGYKCTAVRADGSATFTGAKGDTVEVGAGRLLGCDGAFSAVRAQMGRVSRLSVSFEYIDSGYKELSMPAAADGKHAMPPEALHIWSSGEVMLIALPNDDGSFTCTLFGPFATLETVHNADDASRFFAEHFPDVVPLMPQLADDYLNNPIGALSTVRCSPWNLNQVLLLGDAAHGVVPFYGQGMNCGFEDCLEFDDALVAAGDDWRHALPHFAVERKVATDALADLALGNYVEMRDKTIDHFFVIKCKLDALIHSCVGSKWWQPSLHTAVSFTSMPYHVARNVCERQDRLLARGAAVVATMLMSVTLRWAMRLPRSLQR